MEEEDEDIGSIDTQAFHPSDHRCPCGLGNPETRRCCPSGKIQYQAWSDSL